MELSFVVKYMYYSWSQKNNTHVHIVVKVKKTHTVELAIKNTLTVNFCYSEQFHVNQYMFYYDTLAGYSEFLI